MEQAGAASLTVHKTKHRHLVVIRTTDRHALFTANVGLINLNRSAALPERGKVALTHGFTDTMRQEPGSLDGEAEGARELMRADALL